MYCRYCGKQLSDEAIMCPECGTPIKAIATVAAEQNKASDTPETKSQGNSLGAAAFFLSLFAFVTGIIFGSLMCEFNSASILVIIIGFTSILPALVGISIGIAKVKYDKGAKKVLEVFAIVLSSIVLFFLFLVLCIMFTAY